MEYPETLMLRFGRGTLRCQCRVAWHAWLDSRHELASLQPESGRGASDSTPEAEAFELLALAIAPDFPSPPQPGRSWCTPAGPPSALQGRRCALNILLAASW